MQEAESGIRKAQRSIGAASAVSVGDNNREGRRAATHHGNAPRFRWPRLPSDFTPLSPLQSDEVEL
eukprot:2615287-Rhodomonas_salina.1